MLRLAFVVNAGALGASAIRNEDYILRSYLVAVTATATVIGTAFAIRTVPRRLRDKSVLDIAKSKEM